MNSGVIEIGLKPIYKILGIFGCLFLLSVSAWALYDISTTDDPEKYNDPFLYFAVTIFGFFLIGSIISIFYLSKDKRIISESGIAKTRFGKPVHLEFSKIEEIKLAAVGVTIIGEKKKISIGTAYVNFKKATEAIVEQLLQLEYDKIKGARAFIFAYKSDFSLDENDLIENSRELTVEREKFSFGNLNTVEILVNDEVIGIISHKETKTFRVPEGDHELKVKMDWIYSMPLKFSTNESELKFRITSSIKGLKAIFMFFYLFFKPKSVLQLIKE